MSRSREGSPSLAGWGGLVSKSEKPKKEKNKLQQIDIFGGTEELNIKRKKEVCSKKIYGSSAKHADPSTLKMREIGLSVIIGFEWPDLNAWVDKWGINEGLMTDLRLIQTQ